MSASEKSLALVERAVAALKIKASEKDLIEMAASSRAITTITNTDGYAQCHAARMTLKNQRIEIEKTSKEVREDAVAFNKAVIALEKRFIGLIEPEESRLGKLEKEWDDAREAERQAKVEAELKRVADLQERIAELRGNQNLTASSGSKLIAEHLADLQAIPVDESFEEMQQQAADAKGAGLKRLADLHIAALAHEAEQARIQAEREELARLRAEEQKRQAEERTRIADEERAAKAARAEEERKAREAREAEEARLRKEREEENRWLAEERRRQETELAARRAEQDRIEREQRAVREAEEARIAAERAELARQQRELKEAAERRETEAAAQREREAAAAREQAAKEARRREMTERDQPSALALCEAVSDWFEVDIDIAAQWLAETPHEDWMALATSTEAA